MSLYSQVSVVLLPHQGNLLCKKNGDLPLQKTTANEYVELCSPTQMDKSTEELLQTEQILLDYISEKRAQEF